MLSGDNVYMLTIGNLFSWDRPCLSIACTVQRGFPASESGESIGRYPGKVAWYLPNMAGTVRYLREPVE